MPSPRALLALLLVPLMASMSACAILNMDEGPPTMSERYEDLAVLYPTMEGLVAEAIEPLEDFPGFESRLIMTDPCYGGEHGLEAFDGTAKAHLEYQFAKVYWEDPAVRVDLLEAVKAHWESLGYEVEDEESATGAHRTITASPDGELHIRYRSLGVVLVDVYHASCVEASSFDVIEPAGGVLPEHDRTNLDA
jgi:hypothetical protein